MQSRGCTYTPPLKYNPGSPVYSRKCSDQCLGEVSDFGSIVRPLFRQHTAVEVSVAELCPREPFFQELPNLRESMTN